MNFFHSVFTKQWHFAKTSIEQDFHRKKNVHGIKLRGVSANQGPASTFSCKSRTVTLILSWSTCRFTSVERFNPLKTQSTTRRRQSSLPLSFKNGNKPPAIFDSTRDRLNSKCGSSLMNFQFCFDLTKCCGVSALRFTTLGGNFPAVCRVTTGSWK